MSEIREKALEVFLRAKQMPGYSLSLEKHSQNVARIAETIAQVIEQKEDGSDKNNRKQFSADIAYAAGLLHDIGRCPKKDVGLRHPIIGYEMLKKEGLEIPARIAMTHTYYGYPKIDRTEFWEELDDESTKITKKFMDEVELSDVDLLIQLADTMGHRLGVMTISDRFSDILMRHNIRSAGEHLRELYRIKQYFDKKTGMNIYELFRDEIIKTTMLEPNGIIREKQKVTDETEDKL